MLLGWLSHRGCAYCWRLLAYLPGRATRGPSALLPSLFHAGSAGQEHLLGGSHEFWERACNKAVAEGLFWLHLLGERAWARSYTPALHGQHFHF